MLFIRYAGTRPMMSRGKGISNADTGFIGSIIIYTKDKTNNIKLKEAAFLCMEDRGIVAAIAAYST